MPRLRYIEEGEKTPHTRELIESAKRTGAPDPRVVSIMTRGQVGTGSVEYWNKVLYRNVPDQDLRRTPVRLLLDRALQRRDISATRKSSSLVCCAPRPTASASS